MTVESATASASYTGNGSTTVFTVPFYFLVDTDLKVTRLSAVTGAVSTLVLNSDYTLTGAGNSAGGTLTTSPALPTGDEIYIERNVVAVQETAYPSNSPFPSSSHERALDRLTMLAQQTIAKLTFGLFRDPLTSAYDAGGNRVTNVADGAAPTDLATVQQVDSKVVGAAAGIPPVDVALYSGLASTNAAKGSALVTFTPPDPNAISQAVSVALGGGVPVTWYATAAQLAVDATAATQAAITYAYSSGRRCVYFPGGYTYRFPAASASIDPGNGDISFYGDGTSSLISFEEGTGVGDINTMRKSLFRNTTTTAKGKLEFRNLNFQGDWEQKGWVEGGGPVMFLNAYDEIVIQGCRFENLSWMAMANEYIQNVRVLGNTFNKVCRDMCRFRSSFNVQVIGNRFSHGDDDAVALHSNVTNTAAQIREGIVVASNVFEDVPAIQIIGGRMVNVHHNVLRRCKSSGIFVYTSAGVSSEAPNSVFGVSICDNQVYDQLARAPFSAANAQAIAVYSRAAQGDTSTGSVIPGQIVTATGTAILPWDHRNGRYDASEAVPPPYFVRIQNNTIARTLPAVAAYSTWGYGQTYGYTGPTDPAVTDTALRTTNGIQLDGNVRSAVISGNQASHFAGAFVQLTAGTSDYTADNVMIANNQVSDCMGGFLSASNPAAVRGTGLSVVHNNFDGDPYLLSSNRYSSAGVFNGTWLADTSPYFVNLVSYYGARIEGNKIANVARVVSNSGSANIEVHRNVLRCEPYIEGFSTTNKGIGNCPMAGAQYRYEIFGSDPSLAAFRTLLNTCLQVSGSIPTAGRYVHGTFVQSNSGTAIMGWYRLTTGTAHVSGTDWKTVALT